MFAACIEKVGQEENGIGKKIISYVEKNGLVGVSSKKFACEQIDLGNQFKATLFEHSIHDNESISIEQFNGVFIAGWLVIYNKRSLCEAIGIDAQSTDRKVILSAYQFYGEDLCKHLIGDFSFLLIDNHKQTCYLCRDQMGVRPLYYFQNDHCLICATSLAIFSKLSVVDTTLSDEFLARHCLNVSADWSLTPFEKIQKIAPAYIALLNLSHNWQLKKFKYFQFDPEKRIKLNSEDDYIQEYKRLLNQAVQCRVGKEKYLACESSGGLDSSTIVALAAKNLPSFETNLFAYGYVTEILEEDCILSVSDYVGVTKTELIKDNPDDVKVIEEAYSDFLSYAGYPSISQISTVHTPIYQRAKRDGATVLLSGFGGDEFVTIYGATARVELFLQRRWQAWFSLFKGGYITKRLRAIKWLLYYFRSNNRFEVARHLTHGAMSFLKSSFLKFDVLEQYAIKKLLLDRSKYDADCSSINEFSLENRWCPEMTSRLEECSLAASASGVEYRWPLLDIRLIQFFLSVPSEYKLSEGKPRYFHRQSIKGLLPEELIWKDKSMGGAIKSMQSKFEEVNGSQIFDVDNMCFEDLPEVLRDIIDEKKWRKLLEQTKQVNEKQQFSPKIPILVSSLMPIMTLSEWIKSLEKN